MTTNYRSNYDTEIQRNPLSFIRSGVYGWNTGGITNRNYEGDYWQSGARSDTNARSFTFTPTVLAPQANYGKGNGRALRCLVR